MTTPLCPFCPGRTFHAVKHEFRAAGLIVYLICCSTCSRVVGVVPAPPAA